MAAGEVAEVLTLAGVAVAESETEQAGAAAGELLRVAAPVAVLPAACLACAVAASDAWGPGAAHLAAAGPVAAVAWDAAPALSEAAASAAAAGGKPAAPAAVQAVATAVTVVLPQGLAAALMVQAGAEGACACQHADPCARPMAAAALTLACPHPCRPPLAHMQALRPVSSGAGLMAVLGPPERLQHRLASAGSSLALLAYCRLEVHATCLLSGQTCNQELSTPAQGAGAGADCCQLCAWGSPPEF